MSIRSKLRLLASGLSLVIGTILVSGCHDAPGNPVHAVTRGTAVVAVDLSVPTHPEVIPEKVELSAARNGWTQFAVQLDCSQFSSQPVLRLPQSSDIEVSAYQVLSVPVDLDDAGYVRQTGEQGHTRTVPRVLLPLPMVNGAVDLTALRDPANPQAADQHPHNGSVLIWVDLHVPPQANAGDYEAACELTDVQGNQSAGSVPIHLKVEDLSLPDESHLHYVSALDWNDLVRLHPSLFEALTPRLLSRKDPRIANMLAMLDSYMQLAHENKADFFLPRLQPVVKWPVGKLPEVDWSDFDSMVYPWLTGKGFTDHHPAAFWPLPAPDSLANFDLASRIQFWRQAADHFYQMQWLDRSPVVLHPDSPGQITDAEMILMSAEARQILGCDPQIATLLPLRDDQIQLASAANPSAIALNSTSRLLTAAAGLISPAPTHDWPAEALPPRHWIDATAENGSFQTTGLASEQGVRTLAWLAFARDASVVLCGNPLPTTTGPVPANQLIWCYPGDKFGVDHPLPTIQLKWMRQAEQDYEYLLLASQKDDREDALHMCRLITKPVQLQPDQPNEPLFNLMAGTSDPTASEEARQLIVSRITSHPIDQKKAIETDPVTLQTLRWFTARQRPTLVATGVQWMWNLNPNSTTLADPGNWINAKVNVDLYNPAEDMANGSQLQWTEAQGGWEFHPQPLDIPALSQYQVKSFTTDARFDLNKISADSRQPIQLSFIDGATNQEVPCKFVLPVAISERRQQPINVDGSLDDWFPADAIQLDQPLVRMLNRPALQSQDLQLADPPASIYTSWSDENFYIAFRLGNVATADLRSTRNFVQYDHGRAWGEDLCEMLIQPLYIDNTTGPTLHIVAKPGGNWVEQQTQPHGIWQPFEASGVRYASGLDPAEKIWRGEIAIPWKAIAAKNNGRPGLLRFNFIQHQHATAQSASWAGPIDQSRDGKMAGLLLLKEP
jgi:hypothetical protein